MFQVFNATEELNDAAKYPYLRLFTVSDKSSLTQKYDLMQVEEKWSLPSKGTCIVWKVAVQFEISQWLYYGRKSYSQK